MRPLNPGDAKETHTHMRRMCVCVWQSKDNSLFSLCLWLSCVCRLLACVCVIYTLCKAEFVGGVYLIFCTTWVV